MSVRLSYLFLILSVLVAACGGGGGGTGQDNATDVAPTVSSITPGSSTSINSDTSIEIVFSETMNTDSLNITGTMVAESNGGIWSTVNNQNDTLVITPSSSWSIEVDKTLTIDAADSTGNPVSTINLTYTVEAPAPSVSNVEPAGGAILNGSDQIRIVFSETMNIDSLSLAGDFANEGNGGTWSTTSVTNDTLTLSPISSWSSGIDRNLTVNVNSQLGGTLPTLNLSYSVDNTAPVVTNVSPLNSSAIGAGEQIRINFNESMDEGTVILSGAMSGESNGGVWSTTTYTNDTLTISPVTGWTDGVNRSLSIDVADTAGNAVTPLNMNYSIDATLPSANVNRVNGSAFDENEIIVVTFSESMNTSSFSLGGSLASESDGGVWSSTTYTNDTLTISPLTRWTVGSDRTFVINADDLANNAMSTLNLSYVVENVVYVTLPANGGNDGNNGYISTPKATIPAAISQAASLYSNATIRVASGTYSVNSADTGQIHVILESGISLMGGYAPDWSVRDSSMYITTIADTVPVNTARAVIQVRPDDVYSRLIDGFTITPAGNRSSIDIRGRVVVQNNIINGNTTGAALSNTINISSANSVEIRDNRIYSGNGYGSIISSSSSSSIIAGNNMFTVPSISTFSVYTGISNSGYSSSITIENNIISDRSSLRSFSGIVIQSSGNAVISNNQIESYSNSVGIRASRSNVINIYGNSLFMNGITASVGISMDSPVDFVNRSQRNIYNNIIDTGYSSNAAPNSTGIDLVWGASSTGLTYTTIRNNIINGGGGSGTLPRAIGIRMSSSGNIVDGVIENNIIFTLNSPSIRASSVCIAENNSGVIPVSIRNNTLFGCHEAIYRNITADTPSDLLTVNAMETSLSADGVNVGGNINIAPIFVNLEANDYRFNSDGQNPCVVTQGGLDGAADGWNFNLDIDNLARTDTGNLVGWSLGAYEYDGLCTE